jgi:hypothetical protein
MTETCAAFVYIGYGHVANAMTFSIMKVRTAIVVVPACMQLAKR